MFTTDKSEEECDEKRTWEFFDRIKGAIVSRQIKEK
jgi:hypothetical protein